VFRRHTAALEVGQTEDSETGKGGHSHGEKPSNMEAGQRSGDLQAWPGGLHTAEGLSLHIAVELHGKSGQKCSPGAAVISSCEKRITEQWTILEAEMDGQPSTLQPSWATELMQPGGKAT